MMRLLLIICLIKISLQIEGTLYVLADDNLTKVSVNDYDYTFKYNSTLGYKEQTAVIDMLPGEELSIQVWSIYGGLYLYTQCVFGAYTMQLTNKYFSLWKWDLASPIGVKVLGPKTFVGGDVKPYAVFKMTIPFPGSCRNYKGVALQKEEVTIALSGLFSPLITFEDWHLRLPIIISEVNANGTMMTASGEGMVVNQEYTTNAIRYVPSEVETVDAFKFYFNDYTRNISECSIELIYCFESCGSCVMSGDSKENNCLSCRPGYVPDGNNCVLECNGSKWHLIGGKKKCVDECAGGYPWLIRSSLECVASCPNSLPLMVPSINECVASCSEEYPLYTPQKNECDISCPGDYPFRIEREKLCVLTCSEAYSFTIEEEKLCVNTCPQNYPYEIRQKKQCVNACPNGYPYQIEQEKQCVNNCPYDYSYRIEQEKQCVAACPGEYPFQITEEKQCVNYCPSDYPYQIKQEKQCVSTCPNSYPYQIEQEKQCVKTCPPNYPTLFPQGNLCLISCSFNSLHRYNDTCITESEYKDVLNITPNKTNLTDYDIDSSLKDIIPKLDSISEFLDSLQGKLKGDDFILTMTPHLSNPPSTVHLNDCEAILKKVYGISIDEPLIILIIDEIQKDFLISRVHYYIYDQHFRPLDLSYCDDIEITLNSFILTNSTINWPKYKEMMDKGINICDPSEPFFNDICYPYASNGLDMTIADRRALLYQNVTLCQPDCKFIGINFTTNQSMCNCTINTKRDSEDLIQSSFLNSIPSTNFLIVQCYHRLLHGKDLVGNLAFWIILMLLVLYFVSFSYFLIRGLKHIYSELNKYPSRFTVTQYSHLDHPCDNSPTLSPGRSKRRSIQSTRYSIELFPIQENGKRASQIILNPQVRRNSLFVENMNLDSKQYHQIRKSSFLGDNNDQDNRQSRNESSQFKQVKRNSLIIENMNKDLQQSDSIGKQLQIQTFPKRLPTVGQKLLTAPSIIEKVDLSSPYTLALRSDKRNLLVMYWNVLKFNCFFLRPFFYQSPFDLITVKAQVLLLTLACEIAINALFFTDEIVSEKYAKEGPLLLLSSMLKSVYSSLLNAILIGLLVKLAEYQQLLARIGKEYQVQSSYLTLVAKGMREIKVKITLMFTMGFVLILFCWYYCSIFCIIYHGNQISLFTDEVISLLIASAVAFGGNLLIAGLRYCSLKIKSRNLYYTSLYLTRFV